jgi:hypothetical protein
MPATFGLGAELVDVPRAVEQLDQAGVTEIDASKHDGVLRVDPELEGARIAPQPAQCRLEQGSHSGSLPNPDRWRRSLSTAR